MKKSLIPLYALFALSASLGAKAEHSGRITIPGGENWGRRKRERYSELIEGGMSPQEAFEVVENHGGIIPEKDTP